MAHWDEHGYGRWAVEAGQDLIGFGGLTWSPRWLKPSISYHLHPKSLGRGYASEIANETVRFAVDDLGLDEIIGLARDANLASTRVLRKAGFVFDRFVELDGAPTQMFVFDSKRNALGD